MILNFQDLDLRVFEFEIVEVFFLYILWYETQKVILRKYREFKISRYKTQF